MTEQRTESRSLRTLREIFESGRPLTYIRSAEEQRIAQLLRDAAATLLRATGTGVDAGASPRACAAPTAAAGRRTTARRARGARLHRERTRARPSSTSRTSTSRCAMRRRSAGGCATSTSACFDRGKFVVISSPVKFIPEELERSTRLPRAERSRPRRAGRLPATRGAQISPPADTVDTSEATLLQLARALQGLTLDEARHAVRRALARRQAPRPPTRSPRCSRRSACW